MNDKKHHVSVDITISSIIWALFFWLAIRFFSQISEILYLVFFSVLITLATSTMVNKLESKKINRRVSAIFILLLFFSFFFGVVAVMIKPLTSQIELFAEKAPYILSNLGLVNLDLSQFQSQIALVPNQVYKLAIGTFNGLVQIMAIAFMSFYMTLEMRNLPQYLKYWFGNEKANKYDEIVKKLEQQIGYWLRGELFLMLFVGFLSYLGYTITGIPFALALGVLAGLLELIPNIGPTIAAIPAIFIGLSVSPNHALAALVVAILVQQVENQLLVPFVMKKSTGLNPIVTIIVLFVGLKIGGVLGGIIALPTALAARVILSHLKINGKNNIPEIT